MADMMYSMLPPGFDFFLNDEGGIVVALTDSPTEKFYARWEERGVVMTEEFMSGTARDNFLRMKQRQLDKQA